MIRNGTLGAIALSMLGIVAMAHNGATGVVMERMMGMSAMRDVMRDLAPMMQGQVPFDGITVQEAAAVLQSHAGDQMLALFPEEPIPASSFAKPELWQNWDRFAALSAELKLYSEGLAGAAANGLEAPAPAPAPVASADAGTDSMAGMDHSTMKMAAEPENFSVAELMGVSKRVAAATGQSEAGPAASDLPVGPQFAAMAADDVFERISQTCASCHSQFRNGN
jgi:cytochrome c556